jgi:hypothetical protein
MFCEFVESEPGHCEGIEGCEELNQEVCKTKSLCEFTPTKPASCNPKSGSELCAGSTSDECILSDTEGVWTPPTSTCSGEGCSLEDNRCVKASENKWVDATCTGGTHCTSIVSSDSCTGLSLTWTTINTCSKKVESDPTTCEGSSENECYVDSTYTYLGEGVAACVQTDASSTTTCNYEQTECEGKNADGCSWQATPSSRCLDSVHHLIEAGTDDKTCKGLGSKCSFSSEKKCKNSNGQIVDVNEQLCTACTYTAGKCENKDKETVDLSEEACEAKVTTGCNSETTPGKCTVNNEEKDGISNEVDCKKVGTKCEFKEATEASCDAIDGAPTDTECELKEDKSDCEANNACDWQAATESKCEGESVCNGKAKEQCETTTFDTTLKCKYIGGETCKFENGNEAPGYEEGDGKSACENIVDDSSSCVYKAATCVEYSNCGAPDSEVLFLIF